MRNDTFFLEDRTSEYDVNTGVIKSLSIPQCDLTVTAKGHLQRIFINQLNRNRSNTRDQDQGS